jgi:hypothetical protein
MKEKIIISFFEKDLLLIVAAIINVVKTAFSELHQTKIEE